MRILIACLALLMASPAPADPNPQLVRFVQRELRSYNLDADVSQFATPTVAALHLTMIQPGTWSKKRLRLKSILRNPVLKDPFQ